MSDFALGRDAFDPYIEGMGLRAIPLDATAVCSFAEDKGAELRSWAWSSRTVGWARLTVIETKAGFRVANWAAFPRFDVDAPLCQAELIEVKGKLFLLVLDALYASSDGRGPGTAELERIAAQLHHATPVEERPEWAEGFITPEAIWSRAGTEPALDEGIEAFKSYMAASVAWLDQSADAFREEERRDLYRRMRRSFLDNEPSRPFMTKTFGASWSEPYMERFLFPERQEELSSTEAPISGVPALRVC